MEKMKRLLSAILALVLVLGMMPGVSVTAGAEELEIQPETVAVETTQAATIPEETAAPETAAPVVTEPAETAAPETEAVETIPQETAVPETAPAETVPAETVAEETVPAETIPEETIPEETIPEETIEELEASAEAADAYEEVIPVEKIVVTAEKELAYFTAQKSERVELKYEVTPENASETTVSWVLVQNEQVFRADDGGIIVGEGVQFDTNTGLLEATALDSQEAIVAELYAESLYTADDDYPKDEETEEEEEKPVRSEPVKVTFVNYWMEINLLPLADINRFEEEDTQYNYETYCRVKSGESMDLSVKFMRGLLPGETAAANRNYVVQCLSNPQVEWTMNEGAEQYVTLGTSSTDSTKVTLKAKAVTRTYIVTLTAKDLDTGLEHAVQVVVYPEPYKVLVEAAELPEYVDMDVEKGIITYDLNRVPKDEEIQPVLLSARVYPKEYSDLYPEGNDDKYPNAASYKLTWECSDQIISLKDPNEEDDKNNEMVLRVDPYQGSTTITITSVEDPGFKATLTVNRVRLMDPARLHISVASSKITELIAGQTQTFTAIDTEDKEILTTDVVEWTLPYEEDHPYASITKAGKLTVKKIAVGKVITLRCSIIDSPFEDACIEHQVIVRPKATKVEILPGELASEKYAEDMVCNGETLFVKTNNGVEPFALGFKVYPVNTEEHDLGMFGGAKEEVTWKSSNTSIAAIDPYTSEIVWKGKNGTITLTATTTDGSGKKATVKLNFCQQAENVEIILPGMDSVRSGSSLPLDVKFTPDSIDTVRGVKDVTWEIVGCGLCEENVTCAKISTSGKITAKTVYEDHTVTVRATAKDGSDVYGETTITVKPKKDGILILKENGNYVTKTTQMVDVGDSIVLEAYTLNDEDAGQEYVTWKSSNKSIAAVDAYGSVKVLKTGSATITATAPDGRKATVTIKGVRMASEVIISQAKEQTDLASGKSMTLKATVLDDEGKTATVKKVTWTLEGDGAKYATINSSGKLTAVKDYMGPAVKVTVKATATDGSDADPGEWEVTIYPVAQGVRIDLDDFERTGTSCLYQLGSSPAELSLSAVSYPETASQSHTWKSSNKAIAEVDSEGGLIIKKAGTVTITATANDGSGKKASFKLKIVRAAEDITFSNVNFVGNSRMVVAGGKKVTLNPTLWDADGNKITGRKLEWSIRDFEGDTDNGLAYASISAKGVLTTKAVSEMKTVVVTVKTVEEIDSDDWAVLEHEILVDIYPATTAVKILYNGSENFTNVYMRKPAEGEVVTLELGAVSYNTAATTNAAQAWTWKSSNKKVATVDENGVVTAIKAGTVTITATAKDGTGKKDTIKVTIRN